MTPSSSSAISSKWLKQNTSYYQYIITSPSMKCNQYLPPSPTLSKSANQNKNKLRKYVGVTYEDDEANKVLVI